ncbi:MAG: CHAP domain-containing protein [Rhabdochlamydiaceae bacterium]|nr:CHAP domain-containing protein [Rhabdochlamydiaceae bacterium]
MKYFVAFSLIAFSMNGYSSTSVEKPSTEKCHTELGSCIGQSYLTKAYSNCNGDCVTNENNYVLLKNANKKIISGMKWQCVEYARRWLIDNKNVTFADVTYAYHIWDLKHGQQVDTDQQVPLLQYKNKISKTPPQIGDLLIYSTDLSVTGHVAVVVSVGDNFITIAEQNYFNSLWDGANYSRRLLLDKDEEGGYRIFDDSLIGWVRFAS